MLKKYKWYIYFGICIICLSIGLFHPYGIYGTVNTNAKLPGIVITPQSIGTYKTTKVYNEKTKQAWLIVDGAAIPLQ